MDLSVPGISVVGSCAKEMAVPWKNDERRVDVICTSLRNFEGHTAPSKSYLSTTHIDAKQIEFFTPGQTYTSFQSLSTICLLLRHGL